MVKFAQLFPEEGIVVKLSQQLRWFHFHALIPIKDSSARNFYAEMCRIERWDVRTVRRKIGGMLYERTALSRKPESVISAEIDNLCDGRMSPDIVFRDPYLLDLLGLKGAVSEHGHAGPPGHAFPALPHGRPGPPGDGEVCLRRRHGAAERRGRAWAVVPARRWVQRDQSRTRRHAFRRGGVAGLPGDPRVRGGGNTFSLNSRPRQGMSA